MHIVVTKPPYQVGKEKSQMCEEPPHIHPQQEVEDRWVTGVMNIQIIMILTSTTRIITMVKLKTYDTVMKFLKLEEEDPGSARGLGMGVLWEEDPKTKRPQAKQKGTYIRAF